MSNLLLFAAIGFAAQIVDGAIGMAYGLISTTVLLSLRNTSGDSERQCARRRGIHDRRFGVIALAVWEPRQAPLLEARTCGDDWRRAWCICSGPATPGNLIRPIVGIYLGLMGAVVLWKAFEREERREPRRVRLIGFVGGFLDAVARRRLGVLVASSLVGQGAHARLAIGSTNAAEFLVTVTISATFVMTIGLELWPIIVGLIVGGVVAAPFAAYVTRRLPVRVLMVLVGVAIILLSMREMLRLYGAGWPT